MRVCVSASYIASQPTRASPRTISMGDTSPSFSPIGMVAGTCPPSLWGPEATSESLRWDAVGAPPPPPRGTTQCAWWQSRQAAVCRCSFRPVGQGRSGQTPLGRWQLSMLGSSPLFSLFMRAARLCNLLKLLGRHDKKTNGPVQEGNTPAAGRLARDRARLQGWCNPPGSRRPPASGSRLPAELQHPPLEHRYQPGRASTSP